MLKIFLAICLSLPLCAGATEITIGIPSDQKSAMGFKDGRLTGKLAATFQCPLDNADIAYKMIEVPHSRLLLLLQRGEIDIAMPLIRLEGRDEYATHANTLFLADFALFSQKQIALKDNLSNYSFVVLRATASINLVKKHNGSVTEVSSWVQALKLVQLGRYDGAVIPVVSTGKIPSENFVGLTQSKFGTLPVSFYISHAISNTEELLQRFNAAIDTCRS